MAGPSSWEIADMMEDHYGRKPSHSSVLDWARAFGSVKWTIPPRGRRPIAVDWDETAEKANGREVYAWAAMDVDTGELPAIKATWSSGPGAPWTRSSSEGSRGLREQTDVRRGRGPRYSWAFRELGLEHHRGAFGDRSRVERFSGALKRRTSAFFNNINARRSRIASLDMLMNMSFVYYNGPRFQEGIGRAPSEVIAVLG